ncbi:GH25 family lysozyme [Nocardioides sp. LHD-245]|uniref:glycoside hydrolase family 25 protein n=1 Tax=Nocardioides sp. LHD-245 TaxID=3051387 RepID=UPI0027DFC58B|nr:GH25 family lysozyme [Nocardioides sp. LHD-245]
MTTIACVALLSLAGCGADAPAPAISAPTSTPTATPTAPITPTPTPTPAATPTPVPSPEPALVEGIDASHHQGPIDWPRVAGAGIRFAYLKATEGTGFTDPRFAAHRAAAVRAGVAVAGYHYFQLCSDGTAQAEHFLSVLGTGRDPDLPPAVDLEVAGSCADPPASPTLLAEIREFLTTVDERLGTTTLVYLYPEFEERFGFADDLADHPQWVRRLGDRPPGRAWAVWQYDDRGSVPGVSGGVDRNRGTIPVAKR